VPKIGTGEMLRTAIAKNTPLGRKAHPVMEKGDLVPDDLLVALVRERIAEPDCGRGFVLDGFPRTLPQARGLEEMTEGNPEAWVVFDFEVPRPVLMRRLSGRRWCPSCQATYHLVNDPPKREGVCDACGTGLVQREDDHESVVARRLHEYDERTYPLVEHYRTRARMVPIDGNRPMDVVFRELLEAVEVRA
jgi:adenylate kinase